MGSGVQPEVTSCTEERVRFGRAREVRAYRGRDYMPRANAAAGGRRARSRELKYMRVCTGDGDDGTHAMPVKWAREGKLRELSQ